MTDFDAALAGLYRTFETEPPTAIAGCYCCVGEPQRQVLITRPLRTLTGDELGGYAFNVFLTVGDVGDYRYFLPRIFDLSASDLDWFPSPEVVIGDLARADWAGWSEVERDATLAFLSAWFDRWSSGEMYDGGYNEIDSLLCGMARGSIDITPYLERLLRPENAKALVELHDLNSRAAMTRSPPENFWEDAPEGWRRLTDFLTSDAVRSRLRSIWPHPSTNTGPQAT